MKRVVAFAILTAACGGSDRPEPNQFYQNRADGYSVGQPDGWITSTDRGSTRFAPTNGKQTIVVRSAPRLSEIIEGQPTSNDDITDATRRVLERMTAKLDEPKSINGSELPGVEFSLTYRPPSIGRDYRRTHVVLFGRKRLFHIIQTGPQGEVLDENAMRLMVSTLTEEG